MGGTQAQPSKVARVLVGGKRRRWVASSFLVAGIAAGGFWYVSTSGYEPTSFLVQDVDGAVLGLRVGTCNADVRLANLVEADSEVRILVETRRRTDDDCADWLSVVLSEPIGDRAVVDLANGLRYRAPHAEERCMPSSSGCTVRRGR